MTASSRMLEIWKGIYMIVGEKDGRFPFSHSFLLVGERNILLDAGCGPSVITGLLDEFKVDEIVLSHTHADHFSCLRFSRGVPVLVPEHCEGSVSSLDVLSRRFVRDEEARMEWLSMVEALFGLEPFVPDGSYEEGDVFETGVHELVAVHAPGHTRDHFAFFESRSRLMFVFDVDLTEFGPWYGHLESSVDEFLETMRKIREHRPSGLISSHREPVLDGWEDELNSYEEHIFRRDAEVERMVLEGLSLDEMVERSIIYGGFPHVPKLLRYFEREMLLKHIGRLGLAGELNA